jgi:hypothetical protein
LRRNDSGYRRGRVALFAVALLLALGAGEVLTRRLRVDQRLITPVLFFQGADIPIHRVSPDPVLHYDLAPNTQYDGDLAGHRYHVTIDEHGARFPTHPVAKAPGVFRILCAGASTVYGAAVDDHETIPAALERRLNSAAPAYTHYEAWNFGVSAYTLGQAAHLAHVRLDAVHPDLVLVGLPRGGPRAFLMPPGGALDYPWSEILADPAFFDEQIELTSGLPNRFTEPLLRRSAFLRASLAVLPGFQPPSACRRCETIDRDEAQALSQEAEARGVPVVYYSIPVWRGRPKRDNVLPGLPPQRFIDLYEPNREPDFYEIHPQPPTLDELARLLIKALRERGLIRTAASDANGARPSASPGNPGEVAEPST